MADLNPLIRYKKFQLDEKRKNLSRLYEQMDVLLGTKSSMLNELEAEKNLVSQNPEDIFALQNLSHYSSASKKRIAKTNTDIGKLEARIEIAREDMRLTFGDLKKIEITQENRLDEEAKKLEAKETALFDEIGLEMHRRQNK